MSLFDRFFGKGRHAAAARSAELRGELARATELYGEAGRTEDAARVMLVRADAETDPRQRLQYYAQAATLLPVGHETHKLARARRAELLLALAGDAAVSAVARHEVIEAARDLEAIGEALKAAEAYARAGDKESEARALQAAGDVERLEFLLSTEQDKERESRSRDERTKEIALLLQCGRRREALLALDQLLESHPEDASLRERRNGISQRRLTGPIVIVEAAGTRWKLVLGREIVIGRTEGTIKVSSSAVSREHLRITREGDDVVIRDLGSRNGTQLRGVNVGGALAVHDGLDLKLGREVSVRVAPSTRLAGAVEVDLIGETYVAWLGPTKTPIEGLGLAEGSDGWVELVAEEGHAFMGAVGLTPRTTLLVGDAIATRRGEEPVLRVLGM